ncbi:MAG: hypothetical protein AAB882_00125 [Patescibacteria group bacterium]|mgnify:FL=1
MNILTPERRQELVFRLAFTSAVLGLVIVLGVIGGELWVRWTMNQNFAFLGGFELEALTMSAFALIFGMLYLHRPEQQ